MKQDVHLKKLSEYEHAIESCTNKKWYGGGNYINLSDQNAKIDEKIENIPFLCTIFLLLKKTILLS